MTVTADELILLIGKQAIELDRLRRENEALAALVRELEAAQAKPKTEGAK